MKIYDLVSIIETIYLVNFHKSSYQKVNFPNLQPSFFILYELLINQTHILCCILQNVTEQVFLIVTKKFSIRNRKSSSKLQQIRGSKKLTFAFKKAGFLMFSPSQSNLFRQKKSITYKKAFPALFVTSGDFLVSHCERPKLKDFQEKLTNVSLEKNVEVASINKPQIRPSIASLLATQRIFGLVLWELYESSQTAD